MAITKSALGDIFLAFFHQQDTMPATQEKESSNERASLLGLDVA
jgi:hypothetical protein